MQNISLFNEKDLQHLQKILRVSRKHIIETIKLARVSAGDILAVVRKKNLGFRNLRGFDKPPVTSWMPNHMVNDPILIKSLVFNPTLKYPTIPWKAKGVRINENESTLLPIIMDGFPIELPFITPDKENPLFTKRIFYLIDADAGSANSRLIQ